MTEPYGISFIKNRPKNHTIDIYTDGACHVHTTKSGGWGVLLLYKSIKKELSGFEKDTTNNRMEILAVVKALEALNEPCNVNLYTDSQYTINGISKWINKWKVNNWKTSDKKDVKNKDLWQRLDQAVLPHNIEYHWVKGHSGNPGNERVDYLASTAISTAEQEDVNNNYL